MSSIVIITIILGIIIYVIQKFNKVPKEIENIPFTWGLPIVWALLQQKHHDEIQDVIIKASEGHDIYMHRFGGTGVTQINIQIASPEYVKEVLMASEDVAPKIEYKSGNTLEFFGNGIAFSNGDLWRTYRNLINPAFNNALSPEIVGDTVIDLFSFMQDKLNQPTDMFDVMQRTALEVLGKLVFGYKFGCLESEELTQFIKDYTFIFTTVESVFRIVFPWITKLPTEHNKKFYNAVEKFDKFIIDIIDTRRDEINKGKSYDGRVDLLSSMLEFSKKEGIHANTKQLRDEMVTLFVAGHDTTAMSLSTSLYYLAKYPEMQEKARTEAINILGNEPVTPTSNQLKEMKYINAVIKESLRIYPPAPAIFPRKLSKPIKVGSHILPKDSLCSVGIWQIHHNPKFWENPKQYNPERFLNGERRHPFSWIPFSSGPRNCVGQNFSLMEQKVILSMLLLKYNWTLPENSINKDKLVLEPQFLLRPVDLKLIFTERN